MAGFNTPTVGFSGPVGTAFAADPRQQMIQAIMANTANGAPQYGGPWAGLAKGLSGVLGAATEGKLKGEYADRQKAYQDTIAQAYGGAPAAAPIPQPADPTGQLAQIMVGGAPQGPMPNGQPIAAQAGPVAQAAPTAPVDPQQAMIAKLMSNPDTMEQATALMQKRADQQLEATKPITPFERAQLGSEQVVDSQGNMVPKYQFGRNGSIDAQGNAQPSPVAQAAMGSMGNPAQGGVSAAPTMAVSTPKAVNAGQEKTAQNLADVAAPQAGQDPVQTAADLMATIRQAQKDNEAAPGGAIIGPVNQIVGRITNDALLSPGQMQGRNAYTNLESAGQNIAAKAAKAQFPNRVTNSDLKVAQAGMAFTPHMSQAERTTRLNNMADAGQRAYDMSAISKGAAMENAEVAPADVRAYYLSKGVDPDTFQPTKAQPLPANLQRWMGMGTGQPQSSPQSNAQPQATQAPIKVSDAAGYAQVPKGSQYVAPDGHVRIKQ